MYLRWTVCMIAAGYLLRTAAPPELLSLLNLETVIARLDMIERMIR
jgi:hypothetical protein